MRYLRDRLLHRVLGLLLAVTFLAAVLFAGRSYWVCRTTNTVMDTCCSEERHDACPTLDVASCCDVRTHATPGDTLQPVLSDAIFTSDLVPSFGAPLAVIAPASASRVESRTLPDWTGPPLDRQRAQIAVFLL